MDNFQFLKTNTQKARQQYYNAVVEFEQSYIQREIDKLESEIEKNSNYKEHFQNQLNKLMDDPTDYNQGVRILKSLKIAEADFDAKLQDVANKLSSFGFDYHTDKCFFSIDEISETHNRGLDFHITVYDMTDLENPINLGRVHARLIWVEGFERVSHWRFITTLKK